MELSEARRSLAEMSEEITKFGESLDLDALNDEIAANEDEMVHPDFWNDNVAAQKVIDANNILKGRRDDYLNLTAGVENIETALELLAELPDEDMQAEMEADLQKLSDDLESYRLAQLLNEPYDKNNAIFGVQSYQYIHVYNVVTI